MTTSKRIPSARLSARLWRDDDVAALVTQHREGWADLGMFFALVSMARDLGKGGGDYHFVPWASSPYFDSPPTWGVTPCSGRFGSQGEMSNWWGSQLSGMTVTVT